MANERTLDSAKKELMETQRKMAAYEHALALMRNSWMRTRTH